MTIQNYTGMTNQRIDEMEYAVHGIFVPGSDARAVRAENASRGFNTCGHLDCMRPYKPQRIVLPGGLLFRPGRGRWYCSKECMKAERDRIAALYSDLEEENTEVRSTLMATAPWFGA